MSTTSLSRCYGRSNQDLNTSQTVGSSSPSRQAATPAGSVRSGQVEPRRGAGRVLEPHGAGLRSAGGRRKCRGSRWGDQTTCGGTCSTAGGNCRRLGVWSRRHPPEGLRVTRKNPALCRAGLRLQRSAPLADMARCRIGRDDVPSHGQSPRAGSGGEHRPWSTSSPTEPSEKLPEVWNVRGRYFEDYRVDLPNLLRL
jgi:hypothetical protein